MKNPIYIVVIFWYCMFQCGIALSQTINHIRGQRGVSLSGGITQYSKMNFSDKESIVGASLPYYYLQAGLTQYMNDRLYWKADIEYEKGRIELAEYYTIRCNFLPAYVLKNMFDRFYFNGLSGLHIGYENLKSLEIEDATGTFIYGISTGFEVEAFLVSRTAIIIDGRQLYTLGTERGPFEWTLSLGIKYLLY